MTHSAEAILFIAPFKEIADTAKEVLAELQMDMPVAVASNKAALPIAEAYPEASVLISRGGTARDLKVLQEKTVVEISTSFTDMMLVLEETLQPGDRKIGIVTKDNIIDNVETNFRFLGVEIQVCPCRTEGEIDTVVKSLAKDEIDCVIGCNFAVEAAKKYGLRYGYIRSGKTSIKKAIQEAKNILHSKAAAELQIERLRAIIDNIQEGVLVLGKEREQIFSNRIAETILGNEPASLSEKFFPDFNTEKIVSFGENKVLLKRISLEVQKQLQNEVWIFQEISRIERTEQKVRLSMHEKGFYAKWNFEDIVSYSKKMQELLLRAREFAAVKSNVLIYGESGSGKEGIAQSIHNASGRREQAFVSVNCASLPPNLIESELFGYAEGAFTGARKSGKRGLFELAHKGTIFLDEIAELPLTVQSRLLRVLQEKEIMRVGDDRIVPLDIRIICATNKDLKKMVQEGKFRHDLYYRINVLKIRLLPLRQRQEDILPIFYRYLEKYSAARQQKPQLMAEAEQVLLHYSWPGNIRELKNIAEVLAFEGRPVSADNLRTLLELEDVTEQTDTEEKILLPENLTLKEMEREIFRQLLRRYTPEEVCFKMGISRVTLWRKTK